MAVSDTSSDVPIAASTLSVAELPPWPGSKPETGGAVSDSLAGAADRGDGPYVAAFDTDIDSGAFSTMVIPSALRSIRA